IGYRSFFHAIRGQIKMLAKLSEQSPPKLQLNTMETMPETIENGTLSPTIQSINSAERDLAQDNTNGVLKEERPSECSVS
ncbi:hypothetical protein ACJMK2_041279, partial [Sinanodonta woodiana]